MTIENQRSGDLGNGYYVNPILGGDYPDPSVLRVGDHYYMTHSLFNYGPGLLIWHSYDLINWEPVCNALEGYGGDIWAPDFCQHGDTFYIYYPADKTNWVITAPTPVGPWSEPVDLKVGQIDPGHCVGPDGRRYLHLSGGCIIELSEDGLSTAGELNKVYEGWNYPEEWNVEGFCLESPKITYRKGYYYLTVAEGGTAGPATSHMIVSSRSKTPWGPWEHSPYNPVVHTASRDERWWSRGHGTLVDTPQDDWWIMYHAYEKGYHTLGRQTLLEPVEWTDDGWFRIPEGIRVDQFIKKPCGEAVAHGLPLSDNFAGNKLGLQWRFFGEHDRKRYILDGKSLILNCKGVSPEDSHPILCIPVNQAYELQVVLSLEGEAEGGILLFYNPTCYCGIGWDGKQVVRHRSTKKMFPNHFVGGEIHLRLTNDSHEVVLFFSRDGQNWVKTNQAIETSGYHHNVFGGFISLRAGLYAAGTGKVSFRDFVYRGLNP
jgi:xylan 1,4-beta-xylosidase